MYRNIMDNLNINNNYDNTLRRTVILIKTLQKKNKLTEEEQIKYILILKNLPKYSMKQTITQQNKNMNNT